MEENYLTYEKYREECEVLGESDADAQDKLAGFLHVLGIALNFRDARLADMHILNPHWVVNGIYRIINDESLAARNGVLHEADLRKILPTKDYPRRMHSYLIDLMSKFELCFPARRRGVPCA